MWSPSSQIMNERVSFSPAATGAVVVSQPVPPPTVSKPVPASSLLPVHGGPSLDGLADHIEVLQDRVVIGTDDGDAVVDEVHARGLAPETVLVRRSTLEDVFLRLTGRSLID